MEPVKRLSTMQKKSSAMEGVSTRRVSTAWPAGRLLTARQSRLMSRRSTVKCAMGADMVPKGSGMDKALAVSARTRASISACSSNSPQSRHAQLPPATLPSSLRSLENPRSALDVASQSMLLRRLWEVASLGIRPVSAVPSVGRVWSPQMSLTKMGNFIAKFAMPKILAPRVLGLEALHTKWKRKNEEVRHFSDFLRA